jgi:hypothetical protein
VEVGVDMLDAISGLRAEMSEIRGRYAVGAATPEDGRRYLTCWRAVALHRSAGRRVHLPRRFDDVLAERARLQDEICTELTRRAVDAVFAGAPEDEAPAAGAGVAT